VSGLTTGVAAITAGQNHTCALTTTGSVKCWGRNVNGQVGDNTTTNRWNPVAVTGLASGVTAIAAGGWHTCALMSGGNVKCWGFNAYGQLGDNTTTQRNAPIDVNGLTSGMTVISAGYYHTCSLDSSGSVKCWGNNDNGRLGDGTNVQRNSPTPVSNLSSGVAKIAAGGLHSCARLVAGGLKCWGDDVFGEIGDGIILSYAVPINTAFLVSNSFSYTDNAHKHAVTALGSGETYIYDANGNMTQRIEGGVTYTQVFDAENRLVSVTANSQTTQFVYDGDGNLVKKIKPDGNKTICDPDHHILSSCRRHAN